MKNLNQRIRLHLKNLVKENEEKGYMFIQDIKTMHEQLSKILELMQDKNTESAIRDIMDEHEWAVNHLTTSKDDIEEVYNFIINNTSDYEQINDFERKEFDRMDSGYPKSFNEDVLSEEYQIDESKNKPTNPKLWAASLAWAKRRYKVCPSAYCNGAAAKHYKSKGGGWRKTKK